FIPPSLSTPASIVGSITSPSEASLLLLVPTFLSPTQFKCAKFILRYLPTDSKWWDYYPFQDPNGFGIPNEPTGTPAREVIQTLGPVVNGRPFVSDEKTYGGGVLASWTSYGYDDPGHLSNTSNASQLQAMSGARGNQTSILRHYLEDGHSAVTNLYYDNAGSLTSSVDALTNRTTYGYDSTDTFVTTVTYPNNRVSDYIETQYDFSTGLPVHSWDENRAETTYSYDTVGRLSGITRPDSGGTIITYPTPNETDISRSQSSGIALQSSVNKDGYGRTIKKTIGTGSNLISTDISYDGFGRLYSISNPHSAIPATTDGSTFYTYDQFNRITNIQKADGNSVSTTYSGNAALITDENDHQEQLGYDAFGDLISVSEQSSPSQLGWITGYVYDKLGLPFQIYQMGGTTDTTQWRTSTFVHDSFGRLISQQMPEYGEKIMHYDDDDNLVSITDGAGRSVTYGYDTKNRLTAKVLSSGQSYGYGYDAQDGSGDPYGIGRLTSYSSNGYSAANIIHDIEGRISKESYCLPSDCSYGIAVSASYDLSDHLTDLTYPDGRTIHADFDALGRLADVTSLWRNQPEAYSPIVSSSQYAPPGLLTQSNLGNNIQMNASFSPRLNITGLSYANGQGTLYSKALTWDATAGNLLKSVDAVDSAKTTTYTYDTVNRLQSATANGPSSQYPSALTLTITGAERSVTKLICNGDDSLSSSNNKIGNSRISPDMPPPNCIRETFWDSGTLTVSANQQSDSIVYSSASTNNASVASQLASAINGDNASQLVASVSSNVITLTLKPTAAPGNYNISFQAVDGDPEDFSGTSFAGTLSDPTISNEAPPSGYTLNESYTYDPWGNIQQSGNFSFLQSYSANNQINSNSYQYDTASGNLLYENIAGIVNSYTYDAEGLLTGSNGVSYTRDAFGRRVSRTGSASTEYLYLGGELIASRDPSVGTWSDRVRANGRYIAKVTGGQNSAPVYRLGNHLESTALMTDATGAITGSAEFAPFGQSISFPGTDATLFTGDDLDSENSTYHTVYRNMSSVQGRWLTPDPYLGSIDLTDPQSLNRYAYLRNRALLTNDEYGLDGGYGGDDDGDDDYGDDGGYGGGYGDDGGAPIGSDVTFANGANSMSAQMIMSGGPFDGSLATVTTTIIFCSGCAPVQTAQSSGSSVANTAAIGVMTFGSFIPGPIGAAFGTGLAVHSFATGHYWQGAALAAGAVGQFFCLPGEEVAEAGIALTEVAPAVEAATEATGTVEELSLATSESWGNAQTLARHFAEKGGQFESASEDAYAAEASHFLQRSQAEGLPTKIDSNGVIRVYDPSTNTFGSFNPDGTTRTMFRPSSPTYWDRQPGQLF
ncbi:MAG: hypothetical protein P4L69_24735, partial [Desulfosporosinus sp.]|nr:hypothetical protein [Desulfosporosinus sp.]